MPEDGATQELVGDTGTLTWDAEREQWAIHTPHKRVRAVANRFIGSRQTADLQLEVSNRNPVAFEDFIKRISRCHVRIRRCNEPIKYQGWNRFEYVASLVIPEEENQQAELHQFSENHQLNSVVQTLKDNHIHLIKRGKTEWFIRKDVYLPFKVRCSGKLHNLTYDYRGFTVLDHTPEELSREPIAHTVGKEPTPCWLLHNLNNGVPILEGWWIGGVLPKHGLEQWDYAEVPYRFETRVADTIGRAIARDGALAKRDEYSVPKDGRCEPLRYLRTNGESNYGAYFGHVWVRHHYTGEALEVFKAAHPNWYKHRGFGRMTIRSEYQIETLGSKETQLVFPNFKSLFNRKLPDFNVREFLEKWSQAGGGNHDSSTQNSDYTAGIIIA